MSEKVTLRRYSQSDEEVVLELWRRTWKVTYPKVDFDKRLTWFRPYWKEKLVRTTAITVAEIDAVIVGFFTIDRANGHVDQIAVAPEWWGTGVSVELLDEAKRLSPGCIDLEVNTENERAVRFYKKHGFVHVKFDVSASGRLVHRMHWQK